MNMELRGGTRLIIVRHGESATGGNGSLAGGKWDVPLSEKGYQQAHQLADKFEYTQIDGIITSDLQRAKATAEPLAQKKGLQIVTTPQLRERDYGQDIEGKKKDWEAEAILKELFTFWGAKHEDRRTMQLTEDMETDAEMMKRVIPVFYDAAEAYPDQTVLFVAHCDLMSTFLQTKVTPKEELYNPRNVGHVIVDFNRPTFSLIKMEGIDRLL